MKKYVIIFIPVIFFLITGCNNNSGDLLGPADDLRLEDLVGTWHATRFEWVSTDDPDRRFDIIQAGATVTLTIQQNGRFTLIAQGIGGQETISGTLSVIQNNQLEITYDDDGVEIFSANLDGNTLTLVGSDTFDFNDDGSEEPATLTIVFQRQ